MKEQKQKDIWIYGDHPVETVLKNKKRMIKEIRVAKDVAGLPTNIPIRRVSRGELDALLGREALHQGIAVRCAPLPLFSLDELIETTQNQDTSVVLLLDQVTDPHNIGALMRSAVAFGADAVIAPDAGAPEETGVLAKSASGALDLIPLIRVSNLVRAMEQLKKANYWCVGMDGYAKHSITEQKLPKKCALVMGSEGDGMRRLTAEKCDYLTKLPMSGRMESLNVSNAGAIALYEWFRLWYSDKK